MLKVEKWLHKGTYLTLEITPNTIRVCISGHKNHLLLVKIEKCE